MTWGVWLREWAGILSEVERMKNYCRCSHESMFRSEKVEGIRRKLGMSLTHVILYGVRRNEEPMISSPATDVLLDLPATPQP
jgi:hypothetical protein